MKQITWALLSLLPFFGHAQQDAGIHFEHGLTWQQVKAKAKAENKYIFVDCYATWCGPCKMMASSVFPQKEAGDFFNAHFISVKFQMDKTPGDNENVKAWYNEIDSFSKNYQIRAFPTSLFFDPNGEAVHALTGAYPTAAEFIADASDALDTAQQYITLEKRYKNGDRDPGLLRKMALMYLKEGRDTAAIAMTSRYLATQTDMFTRENIGLITMFVHGSQNNGFRFLVGNVARVDALMGKDFTFQRVGPIIGDEEFGKIMADSTGNGVTTSPRWDVMEAAIKQKYPPLADRAREIVNREQITYFGNSAAWTNFAAAVDEYIRTAGDGVTAEQLNTCAWNAFQNCPDTACLRKALSWSRLSLTMRVGDPMLMDTYANLLYKLGQNKEAIAYEEKVMSLTGEAGKTSYGATIDKMKKGEKTW